MEKQRLRKKIKGLSLISLTIAVVILIIISSLLIYNAKNGVKIRAYKMLQNDVQLLEDKVNAYYVKYSAIPAEIEYKNTTLLDRMFNENKKSPNDGEEYYVIDLKALEGVTLNYGKDYENISTEDDTRKYEDVYIINKDSHHIYYVKGINFDGKWYYTNENDDEVNVVERKKWVSAVDGVNYGEICALDNRGILYTTTTDYEGKINENKDYQEFILMNGKKIIQILAGEYYTVALDDDGKAYILRSKTICLSNIGNELKGKKIISISVGYAHIVAIDERGKVYTFGANNYGQLGDVTTDGSEVPICISNKENELKGKKIISITAGGDHTVALDDEGKVYTGGYNRGGQLGDGTTNDSEVPICISDKENELKGKKIISISAGEGHTVAIDEEGKAYTWGFNYYGQLGDGTTTNSVLPICISDKENELKGKKIISISAGVVHTVAIDEEGKAYTWGDNDFGQLGDGTAIVAPIHIYSAEPICLTDKENELKRMKTVKVVTENTENTEVISLAESGKIYIWEIGDETAIYALPKCISDEDTELKGKRIVDISAGYGYAVALDEEGKVYTWGNNEYGQLGDGTTTNSSLPICLSNKENELKGKKIISISAGGGHTVAIDEEGKVYTWGFNYYGQLGDGTTTNSVLPICISNKENELKGKKIISISAGGGHTVVLDEEGKVYTCGANYFGQWGDGTTTKSLLPICISNKENELKGKKIISISAGGASTIIIDEDGYMNIYGYNLGFNKGRPE